MNDACRFVGKICLKKFHRDKNMYIDKEFGFNLSFRTLPLHDSSQILAVKLAAYNKEVGAVKEWYKKEHMNHELVSGERSKWWVWNAALDISKKSVSQIQTYLKRIADGVFSVNYTGFIWKDCISYNHNDNFFLITYCISMVSLKKKLKQVYMHVFINTVCCYIF